MGIMGINALNNISYSAKEKQTDKQKRQAHLGIAITATTVGVGLTTLALGKSLSKSGRGNLNKLYTYLTKKSDELSKKPVFTKSEQFVQSAVNLGKSTAESTRAVLNTISLKDILFKKITNPIPGVGKACQAITNFFEGVAVKRTESAYATANKNFNKMYEAFECANLKVSKDTAMASNNTINRVKRIFEKNFSVGESLKRINKTKDCYKNLDEKFWEKSFKDFKNMAKDKNTYSSFIAEKMMAGDKTKLFSEVSNNKAAIQFSFKDDYNNLKTLADEIQGMIDPFNKKTMPVLDNIKKNLDTFNKKHSQNAKEAILNDLENLTAFVEDKKIAEQFRKSIESVPKTKLGRLQSLLEMYKGELSEKDYKKLERQVNKAIKSLDKSTTLETNNLFDKRRDLKIGSAPTDMLTLLTTFATVGIGLGRAENSDERKSAALKFGIPAIGTVLTTMYGTLKMFTTAQSLVFGAITGLVINKIGEAADNLRLQAKGQRDPKSNLVEMPTTKEITDAVIDNTVLLSDVKRIYDNTEFLINTIDNIKFEGYKK